MNLQEITTYIRDFGLLPAIVIYFVWFWQKNHKNIIKSIAEQILIYLKSSQHQEPIIRNLIRKDLYIIRYALISIKKGHIQDVIDIIGNCHGDKKKTAISHFCENTLDYDDIKKLPIDTAIKDRLLEITGPEKSKILIANITKAIELNGKSGKVLRELLWSHAINYIEEVINDLEQHFLK